MLNRIHINQKIDGKVYFTSDVHAAHNKDFILNPRGYKNVNEAYTHLYQSWNETVGPNDIVFNLGDWVVGAGTDSVKIAKEMIHGLNGKIYTLFGNHTAGVKQIYRDTLNEQYRTTDSSIEVYPVNYRISSYFWEIMLRSLSIRPLLSLHITRTKVGMKCEIPFTVSVIVIVTYQKIKHLGELM